ncbi:MAG TPA: pyruvate kinase [Miltoncostaeaceae bacterium]|nr:pyruvate kinase [Miltoncostaeaceae bacterium]
MAIRRTKILATLGPATDDPARLDAMVAAGMDGGRINCAHDTPDAWRMRAGALRAAATRAGRPLALLLDLAGPKMRLGTDVRSRQVTPGESVVFAAGGEVPSGAVPVDWPGFADAVSVGRSEIVIGDGTPRFRVVKADAAQGLVTAVCQRPGAVAPRKGIFCTYVASPAPVLGERDLADLAVGVEMNADLVALSFVRSGQDVRRLRGAMDALGSNARVIAKIEKVEAYEALDEIVAVSDGVMVARGDLGVEAGVERVPLIQKDVIRRAEAQGKLVITATQMLESMIEQPEPTRAEATDVANAILDGTSAVMLSGETTVGRFPVEAVAAMASIATEAERGFPVSVDVMSPTTSRPEAVMQAAVHLAQQVDAVALIVSTVSGGAARAAAKYRPRLRVIALSEDERVRRQLALEWGVVPGWLPPRASTLEQHRHTMIKRAMRIADLKRGDVVVLAYGPPAAGPSETSFLAVRTIP